MNLFSGEIDYYGNSSQPTLRLKPTNGSDTQFWSFGDQDQKGLIISLAGLCINAVTRVGNFAYVKRESNADAKFQKFALGYSSQSYFCLQNMKSGKVLGVANTDAVSEASVTLYDKNKTSGMPFEQLWKFRDGFLISAVSDSKVNGKILVLENADETGSPLKLMDMDDCKDGQLWDFQYDFTGITISSLRNKKFLDSDVAFNKSNGLLNQKWWMIKANDFKGALVMTIEFDKS